MATLANPRRSDRPGGTESDPSRSLPPTVAIQIPDLGAIPALQRRPDRGDPAASEPSVADPPPIDSPALHRDEAGRSEQNRTVAERIEAQLIAAERAAAAAGDATAPPSQVAAMPNLESADADTEGETSTTVREPLFDSVEAALANDDFSQASPTLAGQKDQLLEIERDLRQERRRSGRRRNGRGVAPIGIKGSPAALLLAALVVAAAGLSLWILFGGLTGATPDPAALKSTWMGGNPETQETTAIASHEVATPEMAFHAAASGDDPATEPVQADNSRFELVGQPDASPVTPVEGDEPPAVRRLPRVTDHVPQTESPIEFGLAVPDPSPPVSSGSHLPSHHAEQFGGTLDPEARQGQLGLPAPDPRVANHDTN